MFDGESSSTYRVSNILKISAYVQSYLFVFCHFCANLFLKAYRHWFWKKLRTPDFW